VGNHDLIAVGALGFERCSARPAFALERTRAVLGHASRKVLAALPPGRLIEDDALLVHAAIRDVCDYVHTRARVEATDSSMRQDAPGARICFFGHTHEQKLYEIHRGVAEERRPSADVSLGGSGRTYFVNPGAVDAARKDGYSLAECAVFDSSL